MEPSENQDRSESNRSESPDSEIDILDNEKSDCSSSPSEKNAENSSKNNTNNNNGNQATNNGEVVQQDTVARRLMEVVNNVPSRYRSTSSASYTDSAENLIASLSSWDWVTIDGLQLPAVTRNKERYVAVHMVQLKLLSKFPPEIPPEITQKFTMGSHKMTVSEAWTFNSINAVIRKFDLGCQLFTANDELVKLNNVQMFYWNVKLFNLIRINGQYETSIAAAEGASVQMLATAMQLKKQVESDIQAVRAELERLNRSYATNNPIPEDSSSPSSSSVIKILPVS